MTKRIVQFYLFRHGETDWNQVGRFQGHTDIPLNETGRSQARRLQPILERIRPELILSSDLSRAYETAKIATETLTYGSSENRSGARLRHLEFKELREAHLGQAEGLTYDEIVHKLGPKTLERWRSSSQEDLDFGYPGGETGRSVIKRVLGCLEEVALQNPNLGKIALCSHGGVIRRVLTAIAGSELGQFPISNGILYQLEWNRVTKQWRWISESDWNPFTEALVITSQGEMLANDQPIEHEKTKTAFFQNLKKTAGGYRIELGRESIRVHVESTPLFVTGFREESNTVFLRLIDQCEVHCELDRIYLYSENDLRLVLPNGTEARFLSAAYHAFLLRFTEEKNDETWINLGRKKKILKIYQKQD